MTQMSVPKTILVTGATGFIGNILCEKLRDLGYVVRRALRHQSQFDGIVVGELAPDTDWSRALDGVDCVVHLAALVHLRGRGNTIDLNEYRRVNVEATLNLARQASGIGVKRFIFLSSIKVNGESTEPNKPFRADSLVQPKDPYAVSKWEAEQGLYNLSQVTSMEIVCIRPPLVYGPGVKANFLTMMRWLFKGIPMPFAAIQNKRSLVGVHNLVDLIATCIQHPAAANQTFLVSDDNDLSTTELLRRTAIAMKVPIRLFSLPVGLLRQLAYIFGKREIADRLFDSLQVDIGKTKQLLGWVPPFDTDEELAKTASAFLSNVIQ